MPKKEILVNVSMAETRVALVEDGRLTEFSVERKDSSHLVGNIYQGKVTSVLPGIGAAFVDIGLARNGFLYVTDIIAIPPEYRQETDFLEGLTSRLRKIAGLDKKKEPPPTPQPALPKKTDIEKLVKRGEQILVQIVKEPIGTKGARLTSHIGLPGRYLVLLPHDKSRGVSRRIEDAKERRRLKAILSELKLPEEVGLVVRTAGRGRNKQDFLRDARYLLALWQKVKNDSRKVTGSALIHQDRNLVMRTARDLFRKDISQFLVDSPEVFRQVDKYLAITAPHLRSRLKRQDSATPIFKNYDLNRQVETIFSRKVNLACGGSIVIQPTEGLVVIDVNTGKFTGGKDREKTAFQTNLEAADEAVRQLRLRDLGGIIVIDFIDMKKASDRSRVFQALKRAMEPDRAKSDIFPFSQLGLIQISRQRVKPTLEAQLYEVCPGCQGRGLIKSLLTHFFDILREVESHLLKARARRVRITLSPGIASLAEERFKDTLNKLSRQFRVKLTLVSNPSFRDEKVKIERI